MKFVAFERVGSRPSIAVDMGADATPRNCVAMLSHSRGVEGVDESVRADLSTQMAMKFVDSGGLAKLLKSHENNVEEIVCTNNHFDTDGLLTCFTVCHPDTALAHRRFIEDVACAGDFGRSESREAVEMDVVLSELADKIEESAGKDADPLDVRESQYTELMAKLLELLGKPLPSEYVTLASPAMSRLAKTEKMFENRQITITEYRSLDIAHCALSPEAEPLERSSDKFQLIPIFNRALGTRLILTQRTSDGQTDFRVILRYEAKVRFTSRATLPQVDLTPLIDTLHHDTPNCQCHGFRLVGPPWRQSVMYEPSEARVPCELSVSEFVVAVQSFFEKADGARM